MKIRANSNPKMLGLVRNGSSAHDLSCLLGHTVSFFFASPSILLFNNDGGEENTPKIKTTFSEMTKSRECRISLQVQIFRCHPSARFSYLWIHAFFSPLVLGLHPTLVGAILSEPATLFVITKKKTKSIVLDKPCGM